MDQFDCELSQYQSNLLVNYLTYLSLGLLTYKEGIIVVSKLNY